MNNKISVLDIETKEFRIGESVKVKIQVKFTNGEKFLDIRKWLKYPNQSEFFPSQKGICLNFNEWNQVIVMAQELLNSK